MLEVIETTGQLLGPDLICPWCRSGDNLRRHRYGYWCDGCQEQAWKNYGDRTIRCDHLADVAFIPVAWIEDPTYPSYEGGMGRSMLWEPSDTGWRPEEVTQVQRPKSVVPKSIVADPMPLCKSCKERRCQVSVPGYEEELCYSCHQETK